MRGSRSKGRGSCAAKPGPGSTAPIAASRSSWLGRTDARHRVNTTVRRATENAIDHDLEPLADRFARRDRSQRARRFRAHRRREAARSHQIGGQPLRTRSFAPNPTVTGPCFSRVSETGPGDRRRRSPEVAGHAQIVFDHLAQAGQRIVVLGRRRLERHHRRKCQGFDLPLRSFHRLIEIHGR